MFESPENPLLLLGTLAIIQCLLPLYHTTIDPMAPRKDPSSEKEGGGNGPRASRGPGFTLVEDLIIAKAFIAASEDPVKGCSQKGPAFEAAMKEKYDMLIDEQVRVDMALLSRSAQMAKRASVLAGTLSTAGVDGGQVDNDKKLVSPYPNRSAPSLLTRFKRIATLVNKFLAIKKQIKKESGEDDVSYIIKVKEIYKKRNPNSPPFDHCAVADFLEKQAKWMSYQGSVVTTDDSASSAVNSVVRSMGKKKAQDLKAQKAVDDKTIASKNNVQQNVPQESNAQMGDLMLGLNELVKAIRQGVQQKNEEELPAELKRKLQIARAEEELRRLKARTMAAPSSSRRRSTRTGSTFDSGDTIHSSEGGEADEIVGTEICAAPHQYDEVLEVGGNNDMDILAVAADHCYKL
jgi:hypothetical protein